MALGLDVLNVSGSTIWPPRRRPVGVCQRRRIGSGGEMGARTLVNDGKNFLWVTHTLLTRTLVPSSIAWYMLLLYSSMSISESTILGRLISSSPESDEGVYDVGSIPLEPHIPLSADRQLLPASLEGSRSSRTYPGLKGEC